MVRKLKHHESKLLRKVDFLTYKSDAGHRSAQVQRRYHLPGPDVYTKYSHIIGKIRALAHRLSLLPPPSAFRRQQEQLLLEKLQTIGILPLHAKLSDVEKAVTVASICRRRLAVVMTRLRMAESVKVAARLIEQGQVRVGPQVITDPGWCVPRRQEEWVTWVDGGKIKEHVMRYRDEVDDFDLLK
ncbi:hypothetical protein EX30DRAFT_316376 [Ascodesmis nigricans]|uniref:Small ribosomal subunit protein uS4 N-terminal domain-containing protein n=1 Tax=Ascodesmis nigricans TaxID=341454 RepID=A0A4V6RHI3_9PEZI|nr:hypothetical protein EX30DRAFT_316376 [Ascodesmis nigricans]